MMGIDGERDSQEGGAAWQDHDEDHVLETEQLALAEPEDRLPWLESSDDDEEDYEGAGMGRLLGFVAMGLAALAVIVGGIWWATHRSPDQDMVADGSLIEAPKTPYKEAPRNPGGKTFDGTGDSSFAVSEGQNRPARLGDGAPSAPPAPAAGAPAAAGGAAAAAKAPAAGGVGVQVGAYSSQASAEAAWSKLAGQAGGLLSGVSHRVIEGNADIGKVYRLQAVAGDAAGANALCGKLKGAGISCQVK